MRRKRRTGAPLTIFNNLLGAGALLPICKIIVKGFLHKIPDFAHGFNPYQ
jgi:hypothetical protein